MKNSILIIQPYITNYRLPVFQAFSNEYKTTLYASIDKSFDVDINIDDNDFKFIEIKEKKLLKGKLFWQSGLIKYFYQKNPDYLFITANPRYLSTWILLIVAKVKNKKIFLHGQGLYNKNNISILNKITYILFAKLCHKYICYTETSKESLKDLSIYPKCDIAENSIINKNEIEKQDVSQNGILFIGRLREGSNIEILIESMIKINQNTNLFLHIIGSGDSLEKLKKQYKYNWIKFYGAIYDNNKISEISKKCIIGCYPGDAGLSVLHYMSLSLPVIVHSSLNKHMGPEASYVEEDIEGIYFERNNQNSLEDTLKKLVFNKNKILEMQKTSFEKYKYLTNPPLSDRLLNIIRTLE